MHLRTLLAPLSLAVTLALGAAVPTSDVEALIKFPDSNPFGTVHNGVNSNLLHVRVSNHGHEPVTVTRVRGQFREAHGRERPLRNTTVMPLGLPVGPGQKSPLIPFKFHSENKVGDVGLRVWVDFVDGARRSHSVLGYDSTVTVVEPKGSWFDLELLFLYLLLGSAFSGVAYLVYTSYLSPTPVATKSAAAARRRPHAVTAKSASIVDNTDGSRVRVDDEWVPEHHREVRARREVSAWVDAGGVGVGGTGRRCLDRVVTPVGARGKGWPRGAVGPPEEGAAACRGEGAEEGRRRRGRRRTESPKTARMGAATGCFALPVCVLVVESVESCAQSAACTWPG
ncbi:hypothetical protein DMC30DRAFT_291306, partial [Rhodotorula diobovata]